MSRKRVFVAGHRGLVGSALVRRLQQEPDVDLLLVERSVVDLRNQYQVDGWFSSHQPDEVYMAAGTVGGILANMSRPAEFIYDNLMMVGNVIEAARIAGVRKLLYLGSSCIYPRHASQPMAETELLSGKLEPTNEAYAIAKIAGIKLCESYRKQHGCNFISAMPTNLYGPNDNFSLQSGHVVPALIRRFAEARRLGSPSLRLWGTGSARREFLYCDDLADACVFLMQHYEDDCHINVGSGQDVTIAELAGLIRDAICPNAEIEWDSSKPDGAPRKLLDVSRLFDLGWRPKISLAEGIERTRNWLDENAGSARGLAGIPE